MKFWLLVLLTQSVAGFDLNVNVRYVSVASISAVADSMFFDGYVSLMMTYDPKSCVNEGLCLNDTKVWGQPLVDYWTPYKLPFLDVFNAPEDKVNAVLTGTKDQSDGQRTLTYKVTATWSPEYRKQEYPFEELNLFMAFTWNRATYKRTNKLIAKECTQARTIVQTNIDDIPDWAKVNTLPTNWYPSLICGEGQQQFNLALFTPGMKGLQYTTNSAKCPAKDDVSRPGFVTRIVAVYARSDYWVDVFVPAQIVTLINFLTALWNCHGDREYHRAAIGAVVASFLTLFLKMKSIGGSFDWNDFFIIMCLFMLLLLMTLHALFFKRWVDHDHVLDMRLANERRDKAKHRWRHATHKLRRGLKTAGHLREAMQEGHLAKMEGLAEGHFAHFNRDSGQSPMGIEGSHVTHEDHEASHDIHEGHPESSSDQHCAEVKLQSYPGLMPATIEADVDEPPDMDKVDAFSGDPYQNIYRCWDPYLLRSQSSLEEEGKTIILDRLKDETDEDYKARKQEKFRKFSRSRVRTTLLVVGGLYLAMVIIILVYQKTFASS